MPSSAVRSSMIDVTDSLKVTRGFEMRSRIRRLSTIFPPRLVSGAATCRERYSVLAQLAACRGGLDRP